MMKSFHILLIVNLWLFEATGQTKDIALRQVFKQTADSTLILTEKSGWSLKNTNALILSKTGDTVACYRYKVEGPQQTKLKQIPKQLADLINAQYRAIGNSPITLNPYFKIHDIAPDSAQVFWNKVAQLEPWEFKDDQLDGNGCPIIDSANRPHNIYDGVTYTLQLITKSEIKELVFYEPAFYEKQCPGREGRQKMLALLSAFNNVFGEKSLL